MSAILAMDPCNRDYHAGYEVNAEKIGAYEALGSQDIVSPVASGDGIRSGFVALTLTCT
jgi:hypothetical protein